MIFAFIAALIAAIVVAAAITVAASRIAAWRPLVRKRVVVVLDTEDTISGVLWSRRGALLSLRDAEIATDDGPVPADGVVVIERRRVLWIQVTD